MTRRGRDVVIVLALALLPSLAALHSRGFFSPDETYYTEAAREMAQTGDFVVPRFDGHPFLEKPPLIYWLLAGAFSLLGWGFPAAVLLDSLLTAATAWVLLVHVRRTASARAGLLAAVAYLTMLLPTAAARTALTDPALTLCTTVAIAAFLRATTGGALAAGVALGLGVLAKGPIAPLVVGPVLAVALLVRRDRRSAAQALLTIAAAAAVALPWHIALASRGMLDEYLRVFLGQQVVSRAVDTWRQQGPWWYYLPVLWVGMFPWGTHLAAAATRWWRDLRNMTAHDLSAAAWGVAVAVPFATFSLATNKFPHYVLPLLPWLAAALGRWADGRLARGQAARPASWLGPLAGCVNASALAGAVVLLARSPFAAFAPAGTSAVLLAAACGFLLCGVLERHRPAQGWAAAAVLALALHAAADALVLPRLDAHTVERPLAAQIRAALAPGGLPVAHRWFRPSFVTYGVRGWRLTGDEPELEQAFEDSGRQGRPVLVATRDDYEGEVRAAAWRGGGVAALLCRVQGLGELDGEAIGAPIFALERARDGRRWFYDADRPVEGVTGFSGLEGNRWTPTFRWSVAPEARLAIPADPGGPAVLRLRLWGAPLPVGDQRVAVALNGQRLGTLHLGRLPSVGSVAVPANALLPGGVQQLSLTATRLVRPRDVERGSSDPRSLGFALDWIALEPVSETIDLVPPPR